MPVPEHHNEIYHRYMGAAGETFYEDLSHVHNGLNNFLTNLALRYFPQSRDANIIDHGCGYGLLIHFAQTAGYGNVAAVDISTEQVAGEARLGIIGVRAGDIMKTLANLSPGSYDLVVCLDIPEHMAEGDLPPLAKAVHRVRKPGGRWFTQTMNGESPFLDHLRFGDMTHQNAFTRGSLLQLFLLSDFSKSTCYEDAPAPKRIRSNLRWLLWKNVWLPVILYLIPECEWDGKNIILSQNLLCVAVN